MSTVLGSVTPAGFMQLSGLGKFTINISQSIGNPTIYNIEVGGDTRLDVIHMETKPDETIDQFCQRLRGMMRALWQGQPMPEKIPEGRLEKALNRLADKLEGSKTDETSQGQAVQTGMVQDAMAGIKKMIGKKD